MHSAIKCTCHGHVQQLRSREEKAAIVFNEVEKRSPLEETYLYKVDGVDERGLQQNDWERKKNL